MRIFSWVFRPDAPTVHEKLSSLDECIKINIEERRKSKFGWNDADVAKLQALWSSGRLPTPSVTFNHHGDVFVCPELAAELDKIGNEGLTELLLDMGKQGAAIEQREQEHEALDKHPMPRGES